MFFKVKQRSATGRKHCLCVSINTAAELLIWIDIAAQIRSNVMHNYHVVFSTDTQGHHTHCSVPGLHSISVI